jgi:FAD:protein FMN transferase
MGTLDERTMMTNDPLADSHLFSHDAMNTTFALRFRDVDPETARDLAYECFSQIDLLESRLSRFVDSSDISRINHLGAGETLYLHETSYQCLLLALDAHARTGGLFDITLGRQIAHRKAGDDSPPPPLAGSLIIHPDVAAVTCVEPGRVLDLGGIGKGFALDQLRQVLDSWDVNDALLAAGASSWLAVGPSRWSVDLATENQSHRIVLSGQALSASGTNIQGSHIVHPGGNEAMPAAGFRRVWVVAADAALAEIWSTTLMLLDPAEIPALVAEVPELISAHAEMDGGIRDLRAHPV